MKNLGLIITLGLLSAVCVGYGAGVLALQGAYLPGTTVNGIDVSQKSADRLDTMLKESFLEQFSFSVTDIHNETRSFTAKELGVNVDFAAEELPEQNAAVYPYYLLNPSHYQLPAELSVDESILADTIAAVYTTEGKQKPVDAMLTAYIPGEGFQIRPESDGDMPVQEVIRERIKSAILSGQQSVTLDADCYLKAKVRRDDPTLLEQQKAGMQMLGSEVIYDFGDRNIVLNADVFHRWISLSEDGKAVLDEEALKAYVDDLSSATDTRGLPHSFRTFDGRDIVIEKGNYGYAIAKDKELAQLKEDLLNGSRVEREPVYSYKGVSRTGNEYGDTYAEVDMTNQTVHYFKDGKEVLTSLCVTGNLSTNHGTPTGIYSIMYKDRDAVLRGPGYASPVSYWMPFYNGCGFHDATWRGSFGGTIYRGSGSHGCVNMPKSKAKELFDLIEKGVPVILYYREEA